MNMKKRGLGKGLSDLGLGALLGDLKTPAAPINQVEFGSEAVSMEENNTAIDGQLKKLPIQALKPGKYQPRKIMTSDALEELANSIRQQGVIQPIIVRPIGQNQYEIIAGERRWRAAQLAALTHIPAIIRDINDETAMVFALIENIQRRDLNVMEEAAALNRLMTEFQMTHEAIAEAVGKSRTTVTNLLRLLKLNADIRELVETGQIEMGHARALLMLDENNQAIAANMIVTRKLSVRETEDLIRKMMSESLNKTSATSARSEKMILHTLQDRLTQKLGAKVSVTQNAKGRGKLIIEYKNEKELEIILAHVH
ncbi:MAG: chromosome partitioning protein ParB [Gammaproteobacteria bacterium CG_4_10_14_0_8_um_filter_38_16]|nr:MAG: chromosome partitioning protein ParB [Gammaproteobacteria bacterium CG_4_10_14_0_8_um_filter_38_16]PJA03959.1 MAG: chromosome partitioning protein ParB [Gammaproteobacteria bacterium CG_4_10_14_0_2_um_filter_38_22]PJB09714.1 MAG: chromosome partitioning protein ParB [Gammaproteobacteria bacterium CG_4_9_14_3_um_filter_38_9]